LSRLTTIRLPYLLEAALKAEAAIQGKPWQTVLKDLLAEALELEKVGDSADTQQRSAVDLHRAMRKLRK
jgi:hypothetical protein